MPAAIRAVARINNHLTRLLAGYVNSVCPGDIEKLLRSGFNLAKRGSPINSLAVPMFLKARPTVYPGQVKLRWQRVPGAIMYAVERSTMEHGQPKVWERVDETSRPEYVLHGLQPNELHCFRVRALGTKVKGPYSPVAFGKAS